MLQNFMFWLTEEKEEGQAMVEYGLILALVAIVAMAVLVLLGPQVAAVFTAINAAIAGVMP